MATVIRLRRVGTRNRPYYRVVVADKRSPRDGKFIEQLGIYDPKKEGENYRLDMDRIDHWVGNGATPSEVVKNLLKKARKNQPAQAEAQSQDAPVETPAS